MIISERWRAVLWTSLITWLSVASLGQLFRIEVGSGVVVHLSDVVAGIASVFTVSCMFSSKLDMRKYWLFWPVTWFSLAVVVSWTFRLGTVSLHEFAVSSLYFVRWLSYVGMAFGTSLVLDVRRQLFLIILVVKWAMLAFGVLGILQYLFFYDFANLATLGWDPHLHRLAGTFLDPGFAGLWLVFGLLFLAPEEEHVMDKERWWTWHHGLYLLLIVCLGLTFSRASYIAFVLGLVTYAFLRNSWKFLAVVILMFSLVIGFAPKPGGEGVKLERTSTIYLRLINWTQATEVIKDNLLFGVGFNRYRFVQKEYGFVQSDWMRSHAAAGVDNSWLFVWVTTGLGGIMAYSWIWIRAVRKLGRVLSLSGRSRLVKRRRALASVAIASLVAWGAHGMFHNSWFYAPAMGWISLLLGMCLPWEKGLGKER